jgi:hypothetical protein
MERITFSSVVVNAIHDDYSGLRLRKRHFYPQITQIFADLF